MLSDVIYVNIFSDQRNSVKLWLTFKSPFWNWIGMQTKKFLEMQIFKNMHLFQIERKTHFLPVYLIWFLVEILFQLPYFLGYELNPFLRL